MDSHLGLATQSVSYLDVQPIKDDGIVSKIMSEMKLLNEKTDEETNSHYRCCACCEAVFGGGGLS
jgi:hypothetical protein